MDKCLEICRDRPYDWVVYDVLDAYTRKGDFDTIKSLIESNIDLKISIPLRDIGHFCRVCYDGPSHSENRFKIMEYFITLYANRFNINQFADRVFESMIKYHSCLLDRFTELYPEININKCIETSIIGCFPPDVSTITLIVNKYKRSDGILGNGVDVKNILIKLSTYSDYAYLLIIDYLLSEFPDVDIHIPDESIFLMYCRYVKSCQKIQWLLNRYPNVNPRVNKDIAFYHLCGSGDLASVQYWNMRYPDLHTDRDDDTIPLLLNAIQSKNLGVVKFLLNNYPGMNDEEYGPAAINLASCGNQLEMVEFLADYFPNANMVEYNYAPNNPTLIRFLLERYPELNNNEYGLSCIKRASNNDDLNLFKFLISKFNTIPQLDYHRWIQKDGQIARYLNF